MAVGKFPTNALVRDGWRSATNVVPAIIDNAGRHWEQPDRCDIFISERRAAMTVATFAKLKRYDLSNPTGVYQGKMWSAVDHSDRRWFFWYSEPRDGVIYRYARRAILVDESRTVL